MPNSVPIDDVLRLRNALWADDDLLDRFVAENPAGLQPAELDQVANWDRRLAGSFFVERHLRKYSVFFSTTEPVHAYGVVGLVSPLNELVGPSLPAYVDAVLIPF